MRNTGHPHKLKTGLVPKYITKYLATILYTVTTWLIKLQ